MLEVSSDYPRFALLTLRKRIDEISGSDELAGDISPDGQWIDVVICILAIQGHSRVRGHPFLCDSNPYFIGGNVQFCFIRRMLRTTKALSIMDYFQAALISIIAEEMAIVGGVVSHH